MNLEKVEEIKTKARDIFDFSNDDVPWDRIEKYNFKYIPIKDFKVIIGHPTFAYSVSNNKIIGYMENTLEHTGAYAVLDIHERKIIEYSVKGIKDEYALQLLNIIFDIWAGIQQEAINKPERIMQYCVSRVPQTANRQNSIAYKRIAKVERVVQVSEAPTPQGEHRSIELPVWSVMGHWRNYKSGKRVWIAPFLKGKARNDENVQCVGKEYKFVK